MELRPKGSFLAGHLSFPLWLGKGARVGREFARIFSGLNPRSAESAGSVRHAIMHRRYTLEVRRIELPSGRNRFEKGRWIPRKKLPGVITNSLTRKIWETAARSYGRGLLQHRKPNAALE